MKRLKKLKLLDPYNRSRAFYEYIRMLISLALIDPQFIDAAYDYLKSRMGDFVAAEYTQLEAFFIYFEKVCFYSYYLVRTSFRLGFEK